jgi:16S rRNA (guanine527-N7)-methyltransferase
MLLDLSSPALTVNPPVTQTDTEVNEYPDDTLAAALARHSIELPPEQVDLLDRFALLLWDWNEKLNLTRHTTYEKLVGRDVIDTRELAALVHDGESLLDVGSGGGVPGLLLAILRPDVTVELTEATGKKARVLADMVEQLGLNVPVHATRAEAQLARRAFDVVTVRAVGPLAELLGWFQPHWPHIGRLLIIKGPKWTDERGVARHKGLLNNLELRKAAEYPLAGAASSYILKIWSKGQPEK